MELPVQYLRYLPTYLLYKNLKLNVHKVANSDLDPIMTGSAFVVNYIPDPESGTENNLDKTTLFRH